MNNLFNDIEKLYSQGEKNNEGGNRGKSIGKEEFNLGGKKVVLKHKKDETTINNNLGGSNSNENYRKRSRDKETGLVMQGNYENNTNIYTNKIPHQTGGQFFGGGHPKSKPYYISNQNRNMKMMPMYPGQIPMGMGMGMEMYGYPPMQMMRPPPRFRGGFPSNNIREQKPYIE